MDFKAYQKEAYKTAIYPTLGLGITYPTLGLVGESGEVAEKVKKIFRDDGGVLTDERREAIKKELGDVIWYLAAIATEAGLDLNDVAVTNINKLSDRQKRNIISGEGDNR